MQKDTLSIQILGTNPAKLAQQRSQIAALLNKEVTTLVYDSLKPGQLFKDKQPPNLLIILLDDITIAALSQLTALPFDTRPALLVIAEDNDKEKMRHAMQAGARDFFTSPVDPQELHKSLNQIIFDLMRGQAKTGTLTTIINAKGGSGASLIACNLAHIAATLSDSSVVLIDFDLQFGAQSLSLDIKPQHTILEALDDVSRLDYDAIDGYMVRHNSGLRLLATDYEQLVLPGEIEVGDLDQLLTVLISHYDRIFIDLPRQIDPLSATLLERSDQIVIIVQQSLAHMRDARRLTKILKSEFNISEKNILIVVNRYDAKSDLTLEDIQAATESSTIYRIPNDYDAVAHSENLGIPLYDYARDAAITKAMISLADSLRVPIKSRFKHQSFFQRFFHSKSL